MKTRLLSLSFFIAFAFAALAANPTPTPTPTPAPVAAAAALHDLFPTLAEQRDYTLAGDGTIATWTAPKRFVQPTAEQLTAAVAAHAAKVAQVTTIRTGLLAALAALQPGERALFDGVRVEVTVALAQGNLASAKTLLATTPVPDTLAAAKAAMVALFP